MFAVSSDRLVTLLLCLLMLLTSALQCAKADDEHAIAERSRGKNVSPRDPGRLQPHDPPLRHGTDIREIFLYSW